jgi:hypothetical protein
MNSTFDSRIKTRVIIGVVTFFSIAIARTADLATTLHFNPSLSREANPLSSVLGFDAAQLVVSNVIGVAIFLLAPLLIYVVRGPAKIEEKANTLTEHISLQLFRSKLDQNRVLCGVFLGWPLPKNWLQATRVVGFALSWAVVFASLQATFGWWAINHWGMDWYRQYRGILNFRGYPVIELIPPLLVFYSMGYLFYRMEFKGLLSTVGSRTIKGVLRRG